MKRKLCANRLVFAEDLPSASGDRARLERRSESSNHRGLIEDMVRQLVRLGYLVYPGGVGVRGIYALADLVAIDPQHGNPPLFVEALTGASIKAGGHLRKLELARAEHMCFVGPVPAEFVAELPSSSYAIERPRAAITLRGAWVPPHFKVSRLDESLPCFKLGRPHGRRIVRRQISLPNLRFPQDASGFLWAALSEFIVTSEQTAFKQGEDLAGYLRGWTRIPPKASICCVPFERFGLPRSSFHLERGDRRLTFTLGNAQLSAEIRDAQEAWDMVNAWMAQLDFPFVET